MISGVTIKSDGTVLLGNLVSCDGFSADAPFRVQTHIHHDHMVGFNTSKANQHIILSEGTSDLLKAMLNADLPYRSNLRTLSTPGVLEVDGARIQLLPSHHILGGTQVSVEYDDGRRLGYSSDFFWPLDSVIKVDELLVDATYGDPKRVRSYQQAQVDEQVLELVTKRLRSGGRVVVLGYNGRLQQAATLFCDLRYGPALCSPRAEPLFPVYEAHGYGMPPMVSCDSAEGRDRLGAEGACLAFATLPERRHLPWISGFKTVTLSAHMVGKKEPIVEYPNGDATIAFTDHADFDGTLAFIRTTGAQKVWTDPRTGNAEALAEAVRERLRVDCRVVERRESMAWG